MSKTPTAVRLLMEHRKVRFTDIAEHLHKGAAARVLSAREHVQPVTLNAVDQLLKSDGAIHILFALDRLAYLSKHYKIPIKLKAVSLPNSLPEEVTNQIRNKHPLFISLVSE